MNTILRLMGGLIIPVALASACGSSDKSHGAGPDASAGGSGTGGSTSAGTGGTGGSTSGTGGGTAVQCDTTACSNITLPVLGLATPCCISATQCGISLGPLCQDPSVFKVPEGGLQQVPNEKIVHDPKCPAISMSQFGQTIELPGCCDSTGVCGGSTESLSFPGISIPLICSTPKELSSFGVDAGADIPCNYPAGDGGVTDAGSGGATGTGGADAGKKSDGG